MAWSLVMKTQHDYWQEAHDQTMAEMKLDPLYGAVPPSDSGYTFRNDVPTGITLRAGSENMIHCNTEGFWVRGVKVKQDDKEAEIVYNAFKEFLTWSQLTRR
jgi:hypothetical protein